MSETLTRDLADRLALTELLARGARWLDERRFDQTREVFTDDVTARTPGGEVEGADALADLAARQHGDYARTLHVPAAAVIDLDGDTAEVASAANVALTQHDGTVALVAARYRHEARRTPDGWRFSRIEVTPVFRSEPLTNVL